MKKIKLLLFITFISLITSGCTLNYNLTIKDDRSILETVTVTENNNTLEKKYDDYKKEIKEKQKYYKEHEIYREYNIKKLYKSEYSGLEFKKNYPYGSFNYSPNKTSVFNNYAFYEQEDNYVFRLTYPVKESLFPDTNDTGEKLDDAYLNIKSYLKVVDSNSDSYDEKTKTYTWKLDDDFFNNTEGVYIELSKEKDYGLIISDFFENNKVTIIIVISVIILISITAFNIYRLFKKGMKV